jgi:hypothetical protein
MSMSEPQSVTHSDQARMRSSTEQKMKDHGRYGVLALRATELLRDGQSSAEDARRQAAEQIFPHSRTSREKTCPREVFLGLCQAGLIAGVLSGRCEASASGRNRHYARVAVEILRAKPEYATKSKIELWRHVMRESHQDQGKDPNCQMDVVLALWKHGLISEPG